MPDAVLSIEAMRVTRPRQKLVLLEDHDAVHCTQFNAHILKKMMGIESVNYLPEEKYAELMFDSNAFSQQVITGEYFYSVNTGARRTCFGQSIDRTIARQQSRLSVGMSNANRCVSLFKLLDILGRSRREDALFSVHTGEVAFSPEMRITRGLSVQGDASTSLLLSKTRSPKIAVRSVNMLYQGQFSRGIWCQAGETKSYEEHYRENMHRIIHQALRNAGIGLDDIDVLLPHNINSKSWKFLCDSLAFSEERFYGGNIRTEGHCFCNDLAINLCDVLESNAGCRYLLAVAAGAGGMFGASVLEVINLEGFHNERHFI